MANSKGEKTGYSELSSGAKKKIIKSAIHDANADQRRLVESYEKVHGKIKTNK